MLLDSSTIITNDLYIPRKIHTFITDMMRSAYSLSVDSMLFWIVRDKRLQLIKVIFSGISVVSIEPITLYDDELPYGLHWGKGDDDKLILSVHDSYVPVYSNLQAADANSTIRLNSDIIYFFSSTIPGETMQFYSLFFDGKPNFQLWSLHLPFLVYYYIIKNERCLLSDLLGLISAINLPALFKDVFKRYVVSVYKNRTNYTDKPLSAYQLSPNEYTRWLKVGNRWVLQYAPYYYFRLWLNVPLIKYQ